MNVLSLFDGMSCGMIALKRAGIAVDNYYASEIDPYTIAVSKANHPEIIHIGDVCKIKGSDFPKIDLLIAGSPCQGFSFAGKGLNFEDPRSILFFEFVRIWKELKAINPDLKFMLENVQMLYEHELVISKIFGANPIVINAALVSAQNRVRNFWTNINCKAVGLFGEMEPQIPQPKDKGIILSDILETEVDEKYYLSEVALQRIQRKEYSQPKINPDKTGTLNTKNNSGQLSVYSGTTLIAGVIDQNKFRANGDKSMCLVSNYYKGHDNHGMRTVIQVNNAEQFGKQPRQQNRVYDESGLSPALTSTLSSGSPIIVTKIDKKGNIKSNQDKASCLTGGAHSGGNHSDMDLQQIHISNPVQIGSLYDNNSQAGYSEEGKSVTLKSEAGGGGAKSGYYFVQDRIRRLTPIECERLQCVPDTYSKYGMKQSKKTGIWFQIIISDTQRYKMLGNGWNCDVITHIFSYL